MTGGPKPIGAGAGDWWVSCERFTCWARVEGGIVVAGAPVIKKFWKQRQPAKALGRWMRRIGGFRCARLTPPTPQPPGLEPGEEERS